MSRDPNTWGRLAPVMSVERVADALMVSAPTVAKLVAGGRLEVETCSNCSGQTVTAAALGRLFDHDTAARRARR